MTSHRPIESLPSPLAEDERDPGLPTRVLEGLLVRLTPSNDRVERLMRGRGISWPQIVRTASRLFVTRGLVRLHPSPERLVRWAGQQNLSGLSYQAAVRASSDPQAARQVLGLGFEEAFRVLWSPGTSAEARTEMVRQILAHFVGEPEGEGGLQESEAPKTTSGGQPTDERRERRWREWAGLLQPLVNGGAGLSASRDRAMDATVKLAPEDVSRLLALLERAARFPGGAGHLERDVVLARSQAWWAANILVHDQGEAVDEEVLFEAKTHLHRLGETVMDGQLPALLASHPAAGPELVSEAVRSLPGRGSNIAHEIDVLAEGPHGSDERVQRAVLGCAHEASARKRASALSSEHHLWVFRVLAHENPQRAVRFLREGVLTPGTLSSEDLAPLLASSSAEVRKFALERIPGAQSSSGLKEASLDERDEPRPKRSEPRPPHLSGPERTQGGGRFR